MDRTMGSDTVNEIDPGRRGCFALKNDLSAACYSRALLLSMLHISLTISANLLFDKDLDE